MAQSDLAQKLNTEILSSGTEADGAADFEIEPVNVITGDKNRSRQLYYQLKMSMGQAQKIDIIVSFLMESGVRMILKDLEAALDRGVQVRILTGNYLGITQPSALCLLKKELGCHIDLRFYNDSQRSFHPKAYLFHYENKSEIFIGSSNISRSALTSGIEWNYRFTSTSEPASFRLFYDTFEDLFYRHAIQIDDEELNRYSKSWHRPALSKDLARYDSDDPDTKVEVLFQPRGAQIEALYALENSRAEGAVRGLVQATTGIGKTYLAAFDSAGFRRVLFAAHRTEILKQAARSFQNVRHSDDYGFFDGARKDTDKAVIFASVFTLGQKEYLTEHYFPRDYFDYIVIDEFHHAVNEMYQRIVAYFRPQFLLGLTATPERLDGKNIYEICDYNVPYEISLKEAINKGHLVPFHYYGIYDETDYSGLHLRNGQYVPEELTELYTGGKYSRQRYDLIFKYYQKYRSRRALGFCCSRKHAEEMVREFSLRGIPSAAVYSSGNGAFSENRDTAVRKLIDQEIRVIFSVDMFNEGLNIPVLDMVMFLRPTESPTVFLQQLGRGLRTSRGKEYLNVLDFIGNYQKAGKAPLLLSGAKTLPANFTGESPDIEYPDDCLVDFDMRLIDLFREISKRSLSIRERILQEYLHVKEKLDGRTPTRMELFTYMDDDIYQYCQRSAKENPFRRYLDFLKEQNSLTAEEENLYAGIGREFLSVIETTNMQKVYKMPILYSFYNHGDIRLAVTDGEVLESWKEFFDNGTNWKDFTDGITLEQYRAMTDRQHLSKAKSMPIHFLLGSGKGFFVEKDGYALALRDELKDAAQNPAFSKHMGDILQYRTMEYYRRRYEGKG